MAELDYNPSGLIGHLSGGSRSAGRINSPWIFFALVFALGFPSSAVAQFQDPLPAYTTGSIYVFEHMKDPVTVPYDDSTTLPDATVYYGVINNVDETPAARVEFYTHTWSKSPSKSNRPVQVMEGGRLMHADEQGQFQFAIKRNLHFKNISMSGEAAGSREWTRAQEAFSIEAGQQNVLVSRFRKTVPARLMLADGTELTSAAITGRANLLKQSSSFLGKCISLPPDHPYSDAEFRLNHTSGTHSFILNNLAIPGTYNAMVDGRVFKPFSVTAADDELILEEDARPFKLRGSVTDPAGKPIAGAFVILNNDYGSELREANYDAVKEAWRKSAGQYDELGFYMAKTDEDGRYEISGNCAGTFSFLFVYGDGYQAVSRNNLFPSNNPTSILDSNRHIDIRILSSQTFAGSKEIAKITLAQPAFLKTMSIGERFQKQKSFQYLRNNKMGGDLINLWTVKVVQEQAKTLLTVPAGIVFDLIWTGGGTLTTDPAAYFISIDKPLKPGEVREVGDEKWVRER